MYINVYICIYIFETNDKSEVDFGLNLTYGVVVDSNEVPLELGAPIPLPSLANPKACDHVTLTNSLVPSKIYVALLKQICGGRFYPH